MKRRIAGITALLLLAFATTVTAADGAYRIGVLAGPTAIAFAPMVNEPVRLTDGRTVEIQVYPQPANLIAAYLAKEVDAATLPSNAAAQLSGRGAPVSVAATFIWGVLYVVGPAGSSLDALDGDIYSPGRGATPDLVLRYVLEQARLDSTLTVTYGFAQVELSQLLIAGRVGVAVLPEPFVTRVLSANPKLGIVADLQKEFERYAGSGIPQTVLVVRPDDAARDSVVGALRSSVDTVTADPQAAALIVGGMDVGIDAETARSSIPRLNLRMEDATASRDALDRYFRVLYAFEPASIGGELPGDAFYGAVSRP